MPLKVNVSISHVSNDKDTPNKTLEIVVRPEDKVSCFKDRVACIAAVPLLGQELVVGGCAVADERRLLDCGIKDGDVLQFVATHKAAEAAFVQQLTQLLQPRPIAVEELGLLYAHRHGASVGAALKTLGCGGSLRDFLGAQKRFSVAEAGHVSLVPAPTPAPAAGDSDVAARGDEAHETDVEQDVLDAEDKINVAAWQSVGLHVGEALQRVAGESDCECDFKPRLRPLGRDTACEDNAKVDHTAGIDVDGSPVDVAAWHSVGTHVFDALQCDYSDSDGECDLQLRLRARALAKLDQAEPLDGDAVDVSDVDVIAWRNVGSHVGGALRRVRRQSQSSESGSDTEASKRLASCESDADTDAESVRSVASAGSAESFGGVDRSGVDVLAWRTVASRASRVFGVMRATSPAPPHEACAG